MEKKQTEYFIIKEGNYYIKFDDLKPSTTNNLIKAKFFTKKKTAESYLRVFPSKNWKILPITINE